MLIPPPTAIVYMHPHNVLSPIVRGHDRDFLYPTFIFNLLTLPRVSNRPSPREELLETWNEMIAEAVSPGEHSLALRILYGDGGIYDPRLLELHADMLQELGATLDSLARDVDMFARAITLVLQERMLRRTSPR